MRVENPVASRLDESNGKTLSVKHACQAEHERPEGLSALLFLEKVGESPRACVRTGSRRILVSYHKTHKVVRPKANWVASPGVGKNPKLVQRYLQY